MIIDKDNPLAPYVHIYRGGELLRHVKRLDLTAGTVTVFDRNDLASDEKTVDLGPEFDIRLVPCAELRA